MRTKRAHKVKTSGLETFAIISGKGIEYKNPKIGFKFSKSVNRVVSAQYKELKDELDLLDELVIFALSFGKDKIELYSMRKDGNNPNDWKMMLETEWLNGEEV